MVLRRSRAAQSAAAGVPAPVVEVGSGRSAAVTQRVPAMRCKVATPQWLPRSRVATRPTAPISRKIHAARRAEETAEPKSQRYNDRESEILHQFEASSPDRGNRHRTDSEPGVQRQERERGRQHSDVQRVMWIPGRESNERRAECDPSADDEWQALCDAVMCSARSIMTLPITAANTMLGADSLNVALTAPNAAEAEKAAITLVSQFCARIAAAVS